MKHEPTMQEIVDRILATECGKQCEVELDPHITKIANVEWLLPICLQQFGTTIDIAEHPKSNHVVLTFTVLSSRPHTFAHA
jgi:hypothetical protein